MIDKLVSVIIPCYNGEKYINRSIESIYIQDYEFIELIVVDDGSTDNSKDYILSWIDKFSANNRTLKYIYKENGGLGSAISRGLKEVNGEYLTLLDADDKLLQHSISMKVSYLNDNSNLDCVRSNGWSVNGDNRWLFVQEDFEKVEDIFQLLLSGKTNNWAGSYLVRTKALWEKYPSRSIYESRYGQNLQILLPVIYNNGCGFIDFPLMEYIRQTDSLSKKDNVRLETVFKKTDEYFNIRKIILSEIIPEANTAENQSIIENSLIREKMRLSCEFRNKVYSKKFFTILKNNNALTLDDRIDYYRYNSQVWFIIFRVLRKLKDIYINYDDSLNRDR